MGDIGAGRHAAPATPSRPKFLDSARADAILGMASRVLFLEREVADLTGTVRGLEKKIDRLTSMLGERLPKPAPPNQRKADRIRRAR